MPVLAWLCTNRIVNCSGLREDWRILLGQTDLASYHYM
jgi:hypothetical protein